MLLLTTPTQVINLKLSANSNVDWTAAWAEIRDTGITPNTATGTLNTTALTTILSGPTDYNIQWQISLLTVVNRDASNNQLIQLSMSDGTTNANLIPSANLLPGWGLYYIDGQGFQILDSQGLLVPQANVFISGDVTGNGTNNIAVLLANTGVNAGSYIFTNLTVAANGRVMVASNGANANTTVRGVTLLIDSVTSNDTSNAATANSVLWAANNASAQTAVVSLKANAAYQLANQGFVIGTQGFINANLAYGQANLAYTAANSAQTSSNTVYAQANAAYAQANLAYTAANSAANTVAVFANGTLVLADSNLNFNNTATSNVGITANGTTQTNVVITVNAASILAGIVSGNTSNINVTYNANGNTVIDTRLPPGGGGGGAYQVDIYANGTSVVANANLNFNNTATVNVGITANGSTQANAAFTVNINQLAINTAPMVNPLWAAYLGAQ